MSSLASSSPAPTIPQRRAGIPRLSMTLLIIVAVIVGGLLLTLVVTSTLSVNAKSIAPYSAPVSQSGSNPSTLDVSDVNGGITVQSWNQANVLVNGTVTARGFGASTDAVTFVESNTNGVIVFHAVFPSTTGFFFSASYSADINVYVPSSGHFSSAQFTTVNGEIKLSTVDAGSLTLATTNGNVQASGITTTSLTLRTTNGNVDFSCSSCGSITATTTNGGITGTLTSPILAGVFTLNSTNGNVALTLPATGSFTLTANNVNGSISTSGLGISAQTSHSLAANIGAGTGAVSMTTVNGSITITGK